MSHARRYLWPLSLSLLFLLSACGYNGARGPTSASTQPTPSPSANSVVLQVGATQYQPGETIRVTIRNQGTQTISFPDHLTNCTVLLFEHQEGPSWKPVAPCKMMIMTRIRVLKAGATLDVTLMPMLQWPSGKYRAKLAYSALATAPNASTAIGPAITVYSSEFQVAVGDQSR